MVPCGNSTRLLEVMGDVLRVERGWSRGFGPRCVRQEPARLRSDAHPSQGEKAAAQRLAPVPRVDARAGRLVSLTPEFLANLRSTAVAAQQTHPGPWTEERSDQPGWEHGRCLGIRDAAGDAVIKTDSGVYPPEPPVGAFIATCDPLTVVALLDRLVELQQAALRAVAELHQERAVARPIRILENATPPQEERS